MSSLACSSYVKHVATPSHQLTGLTALRPHAQCFSSMARCPCSGTLCLCNSGTCHNAHQHDTLVQVEHHAQTHMLCSAPGLAAEKSSQMPMTLCLKRPRRACAGLPPARAAPTIVHAAPSAKPIRARFAYASTRVGNGRFRKRFPQHRHQKRTLGTNSPNSLVHLTVQLFPTKTDSCLAS